MSDAIEAEPDDETLEFTEWQGADDKFALRIEGNAMIGDHIADGDYVIIQKQLTAREGQIVAFRDDDGEAILRRFHGAGGSVLLEASNPDVRPILRAKVEIIGVLVGVVRKY